MKRFFLKAILIFIIFFVGSMMFALMNHHSGAIPMWIVFAGTIAAIRGVWIYQSHSDKSDKSDKTDEISLKKDD